MHHSFTTTSSFNDTIKIISHKMNHATYVYIYNAPIHKQIQQNINTATTHTYRSQWEGDDNRLIMICIICTFICKHWMYSAVSPKSPSGPPPPWWWWWSLHHWLLLPLRIAHRLPCHLFSNSMLYVRRR